jgi:hypothetical protein
MAKPPVVPVGGARFRTVPLRLATPNHAATRDRRRKPALKLRLTRSPRSVGNPTDAFHACAERLIVSRHHRNN